MSELSTPDGSTHRVLLTGASGFVGSHLAKAIAAHRGARLFSLGRAESDNLRIDLATDLPSVDRVREIAPTHIVHAAAVSSIAECFRDPDRAHRVNVGATSALATAAERIGARFMFFSTDQVFDGESAPYTEDAPRRPLHCYGRTKALAEDAVHAATRNAVILRTSLVFGPSGNGRLSPSDGIIEAARTNRPIPLFFDELRSPVAVRFVAAAVLELLDADFRGILNLSGPHDLSRADFGKEIAMAAGVAPEAAFRAVSRHSVKFEEPRPRDLRMSTALLRATVAATHGSICDEWRRFAPRTA